VLSATEGEELDGFVEAVDVAWSERSHVESVNWLIADDLSWPGELHRTRCEVHGRTEVVAVTAEQSSGCHRASKAGECRMLVDVFAEIEGDVARDAGLERYEHHGVA